MAWIGKLLLVLFSIGLVAGGFLAYVYRWLLTKSVPDIAGQASSPGLDAEVVVRRDHHGIPHIKASTTADLFRAQGFVHAQDRLWQMEQLRRTARGSLSAIFGEAAFDADRYSRTIGFWRAAENELKVLDPEMRKVLGWYAEGVNLYMAERAGRLAAEFRLLRYEPELWTPLDTVALAKVIYWSMSVNWDSELLRFLMLERFGPERAFDVEHVSPMGMPPVHPSLTADEQSQVARTAAALREAYRSAQAWLPHGEGRQGSNAWVLHGRHTESGRAIMCNDPHLQVAIPCPLYEQHLSGPGINAAGAMFPGAPGIAFGHNDGLAWSITNAVTDVQDMYIERVDPKRPDHCLVGNKWHRMETFREEIHVKGEDRPRIIEVRQSRHGPLVSDLVPELDRADLALQWAGAAPGHTLTAIWRLMTAQNCYDGAEALQLWHSPTLNLTLADTQGEMVCLLVGSHPRRRQGMGLIPSPGWDPAYDWDGFVPAKELPADWNPPSGILVNANNRTTDRTDLPWFGCEFDPGFRAQRIHDMLVDLNDATLADMRRMQVDTHSLYAEQLIAEVVRLQPHEGFETHAVNTLTAWNSRMDPDSQGAVIFHYLLDEITHGLFGPQLGDLLGRYRGQVTGALFDFSGFKWVAATRTLDFVTSQATSPRYATPENPNNTSRQQFLAAALTRAVRRLRSEVGESTRRWAWGRVHQIRFNHILGSVRILGPVVNRGPYPIPGDGTSILQTASRAGDPTALVQVSPSYRTIMEIGNWDACLSVINTGQSGHPASRHYDDQMNLWRAGEYHPMPFSDEAVEDATAFIMRLRPE